MIKSRKYYAQFLLLIYLLLWILLFEFILPVNKIFPKPSIVIESFSDLFENYNLGWNYLSTISVIFFSLLIAYWLEWLCFPIILKKFFIKEIFLSVEWLSSYIPGVVLASILIIWFPGSYLTVIVFTILLTLITLKFRAKFLIENLRLDYHHSIRTFGVKENVISRNVLLKAIQPDLFAHLRKKNIYLWSSVLTFEFLNGSGGLGTNLKQILQFKDLSALFMFFFIIGISIFFTTQIIKFIHHKFYFWKA